MSSPGNRMHGMYHDGIDRLARRRDIFMGLFRRKKKEMKILWQLKVCVIKYGPYST